MRIKDCDEIECESCHAEFIVSEVDDARCRGCGLHVCQECADVFHHWDDGNKRGEHGTGDPTERVATLEADARRLEQRVARLQKVACFFRSVILSGEPWSDTCEQEFDAAMRADEESKP